MNDYNTLYNKFNGRKQIIENIVVDNNWRQNTVVDNGIVLFNLEFIPRFILKKRWIKLKVFFLRSHSLFDCHNLCIILKGLNNIILKHG